MSFKSERFAFMKDKLELVIHSDAPLNTTLSSKKGDECTNYQTEMDDLLKRFEIYKNSFYKCKQTVTSQSNNIDQVAVPN